MRNSAQLQEAIVEQERIMRTATSQQTRNYARERISYLKGELMLQREYEKRDPKAAWLAMLKDARSFGPVY